MIDWGLILEISNYFTKLAWRILHITFVLFVIYMFILVGVGSCQIKNKVLDIMDTQIEREM